jgi:hypothetical protein
VRSIGGILLKRIIVTCLIASSAVFAQTEKPKNIYKLTHLSRSEAIVTCQNGADPTFKRLTGNAVMISCGADLKAKWNGKEFICPDNMFVWADESESINDKTSRAYCADYPLNK